MFGPPPDMSHGATCTDHLLDGTETDVDCGGPSRATPPPRHHHLHDRTHADVDCGGARLPKSPDGKVCPAHADCHGRAVTNHLFATAPPCQDHLRNGSETDVDCGGSCPKCPDG